MMVPKARGRHGREVARAGSDGALHVALSYLRKAIKYVRVTEDWVREGSGRGSAGDRLPGTAVPAEGMGVRRPSQPPPNHAVWRACDGQGRAMAAWTVPCR